MSAPLPGGKRIPTPVSLRRRHCRHDQALCRRSRRRLTMPSHRSRLVHLNALRAFEAAARRLSFAAAAEELNVTASAVSQQITTLEDYLGSPLFVRGKSGLA